MEGPEDDRVLVSRARAGDRNAFSTLTERYRQRLVRFCAFLVGDPDEAESLAQEALAVGYVQLASFDESRDFYFWLRGIGLNYCRNYIRKRARHAKPVEPERLAPAADPSGRKQGVLSGILREEQSERLWLALGQLPEAYREAVVLHYLEGLDYAAISEITGDSPGALRVRTLRARSILRNSLGSVVDTWMRTVSDE
jgi:RNA polymerase sigma-70 factor (ECF subfamily)